MNSPDRKRAFKPTVDASHSHQKRMKETFQLQATKKEATMKRRRMGESRPAVVTTVPAEAKSHVPWTIEQACQILGAPNSPPQLIRDALSDFRDVFPAHEILQTEGAIPLLFEKLESCLLVDQVDPLSLLGVDEHEIIATTLQVLANISYDEEHASVLFRCVGIQAIQVVVPLLGHVQSHVQNGASLFLQYIAVDSMECKEAILAQKHLIELLRRNSIEEVTYERTVQLVAVLCESTSFDLTEPFVELLSNLFLKAYSLITSDAKLAIVQAFSHLSKGTAKRIQTVMGTGATHAIACLLNDDDSRLVYASLGCLLNFTEGDESQIQQVIQIPGVLSSVSRVIGENKRQGTPDALRLVKNVSKHSSRQIAALLAHESLLESLVQTADFGNDKRFRNPALQILANICCKGTADQVLAVFDRNVLPTLTQALGLTRFNSVLRDVLDAIKRIWEMSKGYNNESECLRVFEEHHGNEKLLVLLNGNHPDMQAKSLALWELYEVDSDLVDQCLPSDEILDENLAPGRNTDGLFSFSPSAKRLDFGWTLKHDGRRPEQQTDSRNFGNPNRGF